MLQEKEEKQRGLESIEPSEHKIEEAPANARLESKSLSGAN